MMHRFSRHRGVTLVELILYFAILGIVAVLTIPLLFVTMRNRMMQQTVALVEFGGTQVVQTVTLNVRAAERILYPAAGQSGSYVALQMADDAESPVLIGTDGGRVVIIRHASREFLTSEQVAVEQFEVRNTSASSSDRQSIALSFRVTRTILLGQENTYRRDFETAVSLSPVDVLAPRLCASCPVPFCPDAATVQWQVCEGPSICMMATTTLLCK